MSKDIIEDGKYVELTYKVIDQTSGGVLTRSSFRWDMCTAPTRYWRRRSWRNWKARQLVR